MPQDLSGFAGAGGYDEWGVRQSQGVRGSQFGSPVGMMQAAVERFAGQPMPGDAGRVRDALVFRQLGAEDGSGQVSIGMDGSLSLRSKSQPWNLQVAPGSVQVGFDTKQVNQQAGPPSVLFEQQGPEDPMAGKSAAKQELEKMLSTYQGANPDWYRP